MTELKVEYNGTVRLRKHMYMDFEKGDELEVSVDGHTFRGDLLKNHYITVPSWFRQKYDIKLGEEYEVEVKEHVNRYD